MTLTQNDKHNQNLNYTPSIDDLLMEEADLFNDRHDMESMPSSDDEMMVMMDDLEAAMEQERCGQHSTGPKRAISKRRRITSYKELKKYVQAAEWLVDGLLLKHNINLIAAQPGVGKSSMITKILHDEFIKDKSQQFLIVDIECGQSLTFNRLEQMGDDAFEEALHDFTITEEDQNNIKLGSDSFFKLLREDLRSMPAVQIVVIDGLRGLMQDGLCENSSSDISAIMQGLNAIIGACGVTVIMVHHLRKRENQEERSKKAQHLITLDDVRGSSAISAFCRCILGVANQRDGTRTVNMVKNNFANKALSHYTRHWRFNSAGLVDWCELDTKLPPTQDEELEMPDLAALTQEIEAIIAPICSSSHQVFHKTLLESISKSLSGVDQLQSANKWADLPSRMRQKITALLVSILHKHNCKLLETDVNGRPKQNSAWDCSQYHT